MGKLELGKSDLKMRAKAILAAAEEALVEGSTRAAGFDDAADFKRALLKDLDAFEPFHSAVLDYHGRHALNPPFGAKPLGRARLSSATRVVASGRPQAARRDPSVVSKDRVRGKRLQGGKRTGQAGRKES